MEQHAGSVELLDLTGRGAAFEIHLPHAAGLPQTEPRVAESPRAVAVISARSGRGDAGSAGGIAP